MDGSTVEHSDSDSGESWTLLDNTPVYADEAPDFSGNPGGNDRQTDEKDDDTDGISIISDSDHDSATPCDLNFEKCIPEETCPADSQNPQHNLVNSIPTSNIVNHHETMKTEDNDFLGDSNGKLKTYVHRRNKRLSTVLNIIVLGSVITAAGVAIGHMWGAKNDCSMHTTPSVNKILSNLYKLQEENAHLRSKLKELTLMNNIQNQHRNIDLPQKQQRCRKVFEVSLSNQNADKLTKCVDNELLLENQFGEVGYEKDFLNDIGKLKNIYQQNKSWLDEEIARRIKQEEYSIKKMKNNLKTKNHDFKVNKMEKTTRNAQKQIKVVNSKEDLDNLNPTQENKISYADSLKTNKSKKIQKRKLNFGSESIDYVKKKKTKKVDNNLLDNSISEEDFKKDNRYVVHKHKQDRKKHDRQKMHKKQKRKNKYEQWEMKGGYMNDYDDFSITSSQENDFLLKTPDNVILGRDFEPNNIINQLSESEVRSLDSDEKRKVSKSKIYPEIKVKDSNWFDKRALLRMEARKKLERELFGETSPNTAGWYFRRMNKREQCRTKGDNSTNRKQLKRNMNYKMKF